ncbi:MAG TPA: hypothetical protein VGI67_21035 [Thermoleophilaceae bacterium]
MRRRTLVRAARVKRWVVGGAVAVAGFFSAAVSNAAPTTQSSDTDPAPAAPIAGSSSHAGDQRVALLAPPTEPPRASTATSGAVSGG